jgi:hypothetical protein
VTVVSISLLLLEKIYPDILEILRQFFLPSIPEDCWICLFSCLYTEAHE